jgi:hypothetical protein
MFFSFAGERGRGSVCPGAALNYFPGVGECIGELCVVQDAHLFFCSFTQATLEPAGGEKWSTFFSVAQCREAFHDGLGIKEVAEFDSD